MAASADTINRSSCDTAISYDIAELCDCPRRELALDHTKHAFIHCAGKLRLKENPEYAKNNVPKQKHPISFQETGHRTRDLATPIMQAS